MKRRRPERTHEATEFMREYGADVLEEKRVYGPRVPRVKRTRAAGAGRPQPVVRPT